MTISDTLNEIFVPAGSKAVAGFFPIEVDLVLLKVKFNVSFPKDLFSSFSLMFMLLLSSNEEGTSAILSLCLRLISLISSLILSSSAWILTFLALIDLRVSAFNYS